MLSYLPTVLTVSSLEQRFYFICLCSRTAFSFLPLLGIVGLGRLNRGQQRKVYTDWNKTVDMADKVGAVLVVVVVYNISLACIRDDSAANDDLDWSDECGSWNWWASMMLNVGYSLAIRCLRLWPASSRSLVVSCRPSTGYASWNNSSKAFTLMETRLQLLILTQCQIRDRMLQPQQHLPQCHKAHASTPCCSLILLILSNTMLHQFGYWLPSTHNTTEEEQRQQTSIGRSSERWRLVQ